MSDKFLYAYQFTKKWEGGYVNHPADKGGPTNFGVTMGTVQDIADRDPDFLAYLEIQPPITEKTMRDLTAKQAERIFRRNYWDSESLDVFPQRVAAFLFDCHVNHGWRNAVLLAQRGYNATIGVYGQSLIEDGIMGGKTRAALAVETDKLITCMIDAREKFYRSIVANNMSQQVFLKGWLNRVRAQRAYLKEAV